MAHAPRRAAWAAWIGNALEYYDFFVYGTAAALVFGRLFFPAAEPATGILLALATFGVGYVVRPVGALFLGHLGDRYGRKTVLVMTLNLMGISTFLVGCLPTYEQVGILAPILLTVLRVGQGLSVAGVLPSASSMAFEHAPAGRRAFYTSFTMSGTQAGLITATLVYVPLLQWPDDRLLAWAWRVPFWLGMVLLVVSHWIRRTLDETPVFQEAAERRSVAKMPLAIHFQEHWRTILRVAGCSLASTVSTIFGVFALAYAVNVVGIERTTMLWVVAFANGVAHFAIPAWAAASDRLGRKPIVLIGTIVPGLLMFPYLWAIAGGQVLLVFVLGILMSGVFYSAANGVWPCFNAEMFPSRIRMSGLAAGTQVGIALGGFGPVIAAAIVQPGPFGWLPVACLTLGACSVAAISVITARETANVPMHLLGDQ